MTRDQLNAFAALKDGEIAAYSVVETAALMANVDKANGADARVESVQKTSDDALAAAAKDKVDALAAAAAHETQAVADAVASRDAQIASLSSQLAGKAGEYKVSVTAIHEASLTIEAPGEETAWLAVAIKQLLDGLALKHEDELLALALQKFPSLPQQNKEIVLNGLGVPELADLKTDEAKVKYLAKVAKPAFKALPDDERITVFQAAMGL